MTELISASEIIERAAARDYPITQKQLARWHRAELLPHPVRHHPGRGSVSMYPAVAVDYTIQIAALLKHNRDLDWVGWKLWMFGFEVPERYWRDTLGGTFCLYRDVARKFVKHLDTDDDATQAEIVEAFLNADDIPEIAKRMRKTVGKKDFGLFFISITSLLEGEFDGLSIDQSADDPERLVAARALDKGMGLVRSRTDYLEGSEPWLSGDYSNILRDLAPTFARIREEDFFRQLSPDEILKAREELMFLRMFIVGAGQQAKKALGDPNAFGLKFIARLLSITNRDWEAGLLAVWLIARTHPPLRENARNWIKLQLQQLEQPTDPESKPKKLLQTRAVFPFK